MPGVTTPAMHGRMTTGGYHPAVLALPQFEEHQNVDLRGQVLRVSCSSCAVFWVGRQPAEGCDTSTTVWMPPRTSQSVTTVIERGAIAATRSSKMRLVMSSWKPPSLR